MRRHLRFLLLSFVAGLLALVPVSIIEAAGPDDIFRTDQTVSIGADEIIDSDQYLAAQTIDIDGTVRGDVVALADQVNVNGTIEGDLWTATRSVVVNGDVQGDIRVAAESFFLTGSVGRNVVALANSVEVDTPASIGGDLAVYSGKAIVRSNILGDMSGTTSEYQLTGTIGGEDLLEIETAGREEQQGPGAWVMGRIRHWLSLLLIGGLFAVLWRGGALGLGTTAVRRPRASLVAGFLAIAAGIGYSLALLLTLVLASIVLGLLGLGGVLTVVWIAGVLSEVFVVFSYVVTATLVAGALASLLLGRVIMESRFEAGQFEVWGWLALGAGIYAVVAGLPYVGFSVQLLVALMAFGTTGLTAWSALRNIGDAPEADASPPATLPSE